MKACTIFYASNYSKKLIQFEEPFYINVIARKRHRQWPLQLMDAAGSLRRGFQIQGWFYQEPQSRAGFPQSPSC